MRQAVLYIVFPSRQLLSGPDAYGWWTEEGKKLGLHVEILFSDQLTLRSDGSATCAGRHITAPQCVVMRDYNCTVSRFFEQTGIPVLNSWRAMELCRDKFLTAQRLAHCGIPTPQTIYISPSDTYATVSDILGPTFVVKQLDGSRGRNVFLVSSASEYGQAYEACSHNAVAQEYISYSHGRDIRVWVAGGKAVDAVVRTNPGILTSNYSRGGSAVLFTGDRTEVFPMAEAAAEVCGLAFAGVDILFRPDNSFCVCEVNGNAGFRTLSACGGSNIVRTMLEVAAESILKHRIRHEQQRN